MLRDDTPKRHPELVSGSLFFLRIGWWTVDGQRCLHSVQRVLVLKRTAVVWVRSRTGALRDDRRGARPGRLSLHVILTMLLVRIPVHREKGTLSYS